MRTNVARIDRHRTAKGSFIVLAVFCYVATACATTDPNDPALATEDLFERPVPDDPDPEKRSGAAASFIDCDYATSNGGWASDLGLVTSDSNPDAALKAFLDEGLFGIPKSGYLPVAKDTGRILYTYSAGGNPKVAVIVADTDASSGEGSEGWSVETYATCDPAEFDANVDDQLSVDVWVDRDGNRVPTSVVTSFQGAKHCDWESVEFLSYQNRTYVRDPRGVIEGIAFVAPYDGDSDLPGDAYDTAYHHAGRELWISADESMAYIVTDDVVEAWPSAEKPVTCA